MSDMIRLLPETVANQIAAGEVIQRPASALKELVENAVDAGSTKIEVFIKDSGKSSIHIIDNGCGMSPTDARLSFSRHATSKIRTAEDLFSIRTKGFRGEALASVAAVAQVEIKTRRHEDETGTLLQVDGNVFKLQEPVSTAPGTSILVRNLFFNIPARRNFLKSDSIEARHIIDEFERIALAHPEVSFHLNQNGVEIFKLPVSNLRQRIVNVNGANYNERLVPVHEETSLLTISGFVGKPEFSKKTRGEQFLFVNKRYIKDGYLNHAVTNAFEELLSKDSYASYWLYIDIDPSRIDVNIHPTKTEIKFEDERSVYAIVRASVKRSLGQYNVSPALDFDREPTFDVPHAMRFKAVNKPMVTVNTDYNPFKSSTPLASAGWEKMYDRLQEVEVKSHESPATLPLPEVPEKQEYTTLFQLQGFIIGKKQETLLIIDATAAHERILYDRFLLKEEMPLPQHDLFPQTLNFSAGDFHLIQEMEEDLRSMGFDMKVFGVNTYVLQATPSGMMTGNAVQLIERMLEQFKNNASNYSTGKRELLARALSKSMAIKKGSQLSTDEMLAIVNEIEKSEKGKTGIDGKRCAIYLKASELSEFLKGSI